MKYKLKMLVARILDRHPKTCWALLVMWAVGIRDFRETFVEGDIFDQICKGREGQYCGKCEDEQYVS